MTDRDQKNMEEQDIRQAVILAGGMGTRLKPFTDNAPKPMYPVCGRPFIEYLLEQIRGFGIRDILILPGYMADKITDHLGSGEKYGVRISYDVTPADHHTGDRLFHAREKLEPVFLLMYCDNYCPVDYEALKKDFFSHDAMIQISAYENADGYTKSNLLTDEDGKVLVYDKKRLKPGLQGVDIGYALVRRELLDEIDCRHQNFEGAAYPYAVSHDKLFATLTAHRYYSIGSWERIKLTEAFFSNRPAVFLDRDGTLNVKAPKACYIETPEQFVWLDGAREAVRLLNENGFRVLVVTNQPGIARGNLTAGTLDAIHDKMRRDLAEIGAKIDQIYVCPHDWDEGCGCRKPKPGMLYQAQKDHDLDLTGCILIGDDERDMEAGKAAGCRTCQVTDRKNLLQIVRELVKEYG